MKSPVFLRPTCMHEGTFFAIDGTLREVYPGFRVGCLLLYFYACVSVTAGINKSIMSFRSRQGIGISTSLSLWTIRIMHKLLHDFDIRRAKHMLLWTGSRRYLTRSIAFSFVPLEYIDMQCIRRRCLGECFG